MILYPLLGALGATAIVYATSKGDPVLVGAAVSVPWFLAAIYKLIIQPPPT